MTGRTDLERTLDGFFGEGPESASDHAVLRALDAIDRTKQRRDLFAPRRFSLMISFSRLAAAVLVAVVAIGGGLYLLGQRPSVGSSPKPLVSPTSPANGSPSPLAGATTPEPSTDTSQWLAYTSTTYGFSVKYPQGGWFARPATQHWETAGRTTVEAAAVGAQGEAPFDILWSPSGWPDFRAFESRIPAGTTADAFLTALNSDGVANACYPAPSSSSLQQTTVDGHPAVLAYAGCNEHFYYSEATVVVGQRVWVFILNGPDRTLIVPFLSTVKIDPKSVVD